MPDQWSAGWGAFHRRSPTGEAAKGTPLKEVTSLAVVPFSFPVFISMVVWAFRRGVSARLGLGGELGIWGALVPWAKAALILRGDGRKRLLFGGIYRGDLGLGLLCVHIVDLRIDRKLLVRHRYQKAANQKVDRCCSL